MNGQGSEQVASLKGPQLKLDRAKHHIRDLEAARQRFFDANPYDLWEKENLETGQRELVVKRADPVPDSLSLISGDVIHNLRSALDHLIWQLVVANGGEPNDKTAFPIWQSETKYKSGRPGYAKGISKAALKILDGLKPYEGGNDALWRLHKLDIIDKHRLLLTVAARQEHVTIDFGLLAGELLGKSDWPSMPVTLNPAERDMIEVGTVVFAAPLEEESKMHLELAFGVALYEPEISIYEPVGKALNELASFVGEVIDLFAPLIDE
ncbi:MAG TPA: hypothetical protein VFZ29_01640 [Solirubrobacterales bacterium]